MLRVKYERLTQGQVDRARREGVCAPLPTCDADYYLGTERILSREYEVEEKVVLFSTSSDRRSLFYTVKISPLTSEIECSGMLCYGFDVCPHIAEVLIHEKIVLNVYPPRPAPPLPAPVAKAQKGQPPPDNWLWTKFPNDRIAGADESATRGKTQEELLDLACRHKDGAERRRGTRIRLLELQRRYRDPAWRYHLIAAQGPDQRGQQEKAD